jgi:hypothetical protein
VSIFTEQLAISPGVDPVVEDLVAACTFDATRRLLGLPENGTTGINPLIIKSKNTGERIALSLTVGAMITNKALPQRRLQLLPLHKQLNQTGVPDVNYRGSLWSAFSWRQSSESASSRKASVSFDLRPFGILP